MKEILPGDIFGRLRVLRISNIRTKSRAKRYECICSCGKETTVIGTSLRNGVSSCGCLRVDLLVKRNTTHQKTNTILYHKWDSMLQRCGNKNNNKFKIYGARGISVCEEWKSNFSNFYSWAVANGWKEGLVIDRIDTNGNYAPDNCRFVEIKINNRNMITSKKWNVKGVCFESLSLGAEYFGVSSATIRRWCDGYITTSNSFIQKRENCFSVNKY